MISSDYPLHKLGWKAFQDLCIAIVEERLKRPVQTFLPTNDAGRDGAFLGVWDGESKGESTIQCKFTSKKDKNLTLSLLSDELEKVRYLAGLNLADDYIILTNHPITGASELKIKEAFQSYGVGRCRVFHRDWIIQRIYDSPSLRMMVPRLYGLSDLTGLLDLRAYKQAQLILSEMGDNLQKLVVTGAHRKSVRAISEYNFVLLLGSPAAGKSTIGASLAIGAADIWNCSIIKSTSPQHLERHLDPDGGQFFWVDDAWGSTQYQRDRTEAWNQMFPLIQGAMRRGSKFLFTSRDYIWAAARKELKTQSLPVLTKSQVVIDVHEITTEEKARILYNHIKLGDQKTKFRTKTKEYLPEISVMNEFLPESARRFGSEIFTERLRVDRSGIIDFFSRPKEFLEQTIESLSPESKGAIALVFLNGGVVRSPVPTETLEKPALSFGVNVSALRSELESLNGSLLILAEDEEGPFWTYRHPTVSDSFASYVARSPELVEIYLRGAKPETIVREVVCSGETVFGAAVTVPNSMHKLLADRIGSLPSHSLSSFISYRSNSSFTKRLLESRPDLWKRLNNYSVPLKDDIDVDLLITLHKQQLLPEEYLRQFIMEVHEAAVDWADDSFLENDDIRSVIPEAERNKILGDVKLKVLGNTSKHINRVRDDWDTDYNPHDCFDELKSSFQSFIKALADEIDSDDILKQIECSIQSAIWEMEDDWEDSSVNDEPLLQSASIEQGLEELFRDVDE